VKQRVATLLASDLTLKETHNSHKSNCAHHDGACITRNRALTSAVSMAAPILTTSFFAPEFGLVPIKVASLANFLPFGGVATTSSSPSRGTVRNCTRWPAAGVEGAEAAPLAEDDPALLESFVFRFLSANLLAAADARDPLSESTMPAADYSACGLAKFFF
jgi:hypothetical protein